MDLNSYEKHFIPLESNPDVFNKLVHDLGMKPSIRFEDVVTLDNDVMLSDPALALILIFPTSDAYEAQKSEEESLCTDYTGETAGAIVWFRQCINNACGLYAILHAIYNSEAKFSIQPGSLLAKLLGDPKELTLQQRSYALLQSEELETMYGKAASQGISVPPENPEEEVDFHFVTFVKGADDHIIELDGDRKGPIERGIVLRPGEDLLSRNGRDFLRKIIEREAGRNDGFSLMALVHRPEQDYEVLGSFSHRKINN